MVTSEMQGSVEETTKEQDMSIYKQLKNKEIDEVDYIELEYGTLASTFNNVKSYKVNLETKTLDIIYFTQEELEDVQPQNQEAQDLNSRVSDISTYLSSSDETTIADIEKSILKIETNKILRGGM
jgi:hypothetical protein